MIAIKFCSLGGKTTEFYVDSAGCLLQRLNERPVFGYTINEACELHQFLTKLVEYHDTVSVKQRMEMDARIALRECGDE